MYSELTGCLLLAYCFFEPNETKLGEVPFYGGTASLYFFFLKLSTATIKTAYHIVIILQL